MTAALHTFRGNRASVARRGVPAWSPLLAAFIVGLASCTSTAPPRRNGAAVEPDAAPTSIEGAARPGPSESSPPTEVSAGGGRSAGISVRIHPLTRVATDANNAAAIILHLDARDAFGQSARIRGVLRVQLKNLTAGAGGTPEADESARAWTIDLTDPAKNAAMFDDLITRTYTVLLARPPEVLMRWTRGEIALNPPPAVSVRIAVEGRGGEELSASAPLTR